MGQGRKFSNGFKKKGLGTKGGKIISEEEISQTLENDPLIKDIINSGAKISVENVVFTARDKSGQIVWLETGDDRSGLEHIKKHLKQFVSKHNMQEKTLIGHLKNVITRGRIVSSQIKKLPNGLDGFEKIYLYKGKHLTVCATGTNGYIVTMYPIKEETKWKKLL